MMMKPLVIITFAYLCFGCNTKPLISGIQEIHSGKLEDSIPKLVIAPLDDIDSGDPFTIDSAWTEDHMLFIKITYSGGCEEHAFKLYSNKLYMKSLPPQVKVLLVHDDKGDVCRGIQKKMLKFDIRNLQSKEFNTLNIRLTNYKNRVEYTY